MALKSDRSAARCLVRLLTTTALTSLWALSVSVAQAQEVHINQNGGTGDDGGTIDHQNDANITYGGIAYMGTANGGTGDDGVTGPGDNGGDGGSVTLTNTATIVTNSGIFGGAGGIVASADGGTGGEGGLVTILLVTSGGNGGNGGAGGTVSVTATGGSHITTDGLFSAGITATANGGNGGAGGGWFGAIASDPGNGGNGGNAGSAYADNGGTIVTNGLYSAGLLVRAAGGAGGDGASGLGLVAGGGNGGAATIGGTAEGINSGSITTNNHYSAGMVVQSIGGGGGDGSSASGLVAFGGTGAPGNHGGTATGTNTGHIATSGIASIGMLVESIGGGGGNGAGAGGLVSIGGGGSGGGDGNTANANLGGIIETIGNGSHGVLAQSVGGGGGNGGFAGSVGAVLSVSIGGSGGTGGHGGTVNVNQAGAGPTIGTTGDSAIGILAQSVGGGGGNGGAAAGAAGLVTVGVGGSGNAGGNGGAVNYNVANAHVTTEGSDSIGILAQSVGGGGGNGGFTFTASGGLSVGVGGSGAAGGHGDVVNMTSGGSVETSGIRSAGIIAQSIGGGGGNGGFTVGGSLGASVGIGGGGSGGGDGAAVTFQTAQGAQQSIITHAADSAGIIVQSVGGGGGNGGFSGALSVAATVGVGGSGGGGGASGAVSATYNGSIETWGVRSAGLIAQSIGGGGGNGGGVIGGSVGLNVGIGGAGAGGGNAQAVDVISNGIAITTHSADSAGLIAQSIGGGGGNGGFALDVGAAVNVGIGGSGGRAGEAGIVDVSLADGSIHTMGDRSMGILAQSVGGGGGQGGGAATTGIINVSVGGSGGAGGDGKAVTVDNGADLHTQGFQSHALLAQSIGGGGGSGGFAIAVGGPSFAIGGGGDAGGSSEKVTVRNSGTIHTEGDLASGIFAQSLGGSGGDGGLAGAGGLLVAVAVGGNAGNGGAGGEVEVVNNADVTTGGALAHGIIAQSIGGGGGNGGSAGAVAVGVFGAGGVAVGGSGGDGNDGNTVSVTHTGDIHVNGVGSKGILAQSVGGGGGNGGMAFSGAFSGGIYGSAAASVSIGGWAGDGGNGGAVTVKADGEIIADSDVTGAGGILAQSIGGGGGNGGRATSIAGAVSNGVAVNLGVAVGGWAGDGGMGGDVVVETGLTDSGLIETSGYQAAGILAQSIGGSGGNGGDSWSAAGGYGLNVTVSATVTVGGGSGDGNTSGTVDVTNAMTVTTSGDSSAAIIAQSIGGGGGNGGSTNGATADLGGGNGVNVAANVGIGGVGGTGNHANTVNVVNRGTLITTGDLSSGIVAQSIGGGGGNGGSSNAKAYHLGGTSQTSVTVNVAASGEGGGGGDGRKVTVDNTGLIATSGYASHGIFAQSVGGGGGSGGAATAGEEIIAGDAGNTSVSIGFALGLNGGGAGEGGDVDITNNAWIITNGEDSYGISASSIGGGGGFGGSATAGSTAEYSIGGAIGTDGGGAGGGGTVIVRNLSGGSIWTQQERSIGIFAQSVGGGGGSGGAGKTTGGDGGTVDVKLSIGGSGEVGGNGSTVTVENAGTIRTDKAHSHGVMAQSIGGSGGNGGASGSDVGDAEIAIALTLGGAGGDGGTGGTVNVTNFANGSILTKGDSSHGIFAQSVGGGGGAAGAGSTESGEADTSVALTLGGVGGAGSIGGDVTVDNQGAIRTEGYISHGIFAQSVGGGGGASGAASNASEADLKIGAQISLPAGDGSKGGDVTVYNSGIIETMKDGSLGIFAQSVGGGGGYGGVVSDDAGGDESYAVKLGGFGGAGADGGDVRVEVTGDIVTHGERAHGVVAQSVGGGGGYGGDAKGKAGASLALGGLAGDGGNGGDVTVIRTGTIVTTGKDSVAIIAQSVGGGGGIGGAGFGRFGVSEDGDSALGDTIGFQMPKGSQGHGGEVTIIQSGEILTYGDRGHGIVAQAVGGGGGIAGTSSMAMGNSGAGSLGGAGIAADAKATAKNTVAVLGASSYALFGQSTTGAGTSGLVNLTAEENLFAQGANSIAAYGESTSNIGFARGNITMDLKGQFTIGGGDTGVAVMLVGGDDNVVNNNSLTYAMGATGLPVVPLGTVLETLLDDFSPLSILGTSGNDLVNNIRTGTTLGRVIGNIDLGFGDNGFHNFQTASMVGLDYIDLGGGLFTNDGMMTNNGIGVIAPINVIGGFTQTGTGLYVTDISLNIHDNDFLDLTGAGNFSGEAPLNFTSIDRLFDRDGYVIASGVTMATTMTPSLVHPAVGFDFRTRVDNGTDLVLYSDSPAFEELINDPASGVTDPGVIQMAQYMDGLENVPALYDEPSELARMINMLRFSQTEEEFGKALTRLTPHYAVHTFEMLNRSTDTMLQTARECSAWPDTYDYDGRCIWFTVSPQQDYDRDAGPGTSSRADLYRTLSLGGMGEVSENWSLGATIGRTEFESDISFKGDQLSHTAGESWQAFALARYANDRYFADFAVGGGTGRFEGARDTTIAQVGYIPGETLAGQYLDELLHEGIGNSVTYDQKSSQFSGSARFGFTRHLGDIYMQPTLQFDARYLKVSGKESGSVAAFDFSGSSNVYLSATPGIEIGTDIALSDIASLRLYAKGGVEFSDADWKIEGQFKAAEGLGAPPLALTEAVDSPLYRVGAGIELNGVNGVGLAIRYNGAFGERVEMNAVSAAFKFRF